MKIFSDLFRRHARWTVWSDFIMLTAISISNTVDKINAKSRTDLYRTISSKYNAQEQAAFREAFGELIQGLGSHIEQDFLGELFMLLGLGNDHVGQFFTPYSICATMARMTSIDLAQQIAQQGWVSVADCACGAGATLIAYANECRRQEINYHTSVLFVAQDIDRIAGCMCYIQLSLLGCPGYVQIGDALTDPLISIDGRGLIPRHGPNIWYTPFYYIDVWHYRRICARMYLLMCSNEKIDSDPEAAT